MPEGINTYLKITHSLSKGNLTLKLDYGDTPGQSFTDYTKYYTSETVLGTTDSATWSKHNLRSERYVTLFRTYKSVKKISLLFFKLIKSALEKTSNTTSLACLLHLGYLIARKWHNIMTILISAVVLLLLYLCVFCPHFQGIHVLCSPWPSEIVFWEWEKKMYKNILTFSGSYS